MAREFPGASRPRITSLGIWLLIPLMLGTIFYRSYSIVPDSPEFAGLDDGFSGGILERTPFKFDEELGDDDHDYLAAVRVPRPAHPGVVGRGKFHSNALQAASCGGHEKVVQTLFDAGAEMALQIG
ncbi:hypothetical protein V1520DRAFT_357910 [Lipomyces starkeyi]